LKSIRVVNQEFAESYRIRTTLVDLLPGLVASRVGVFVVTPRFPKQRNNKYNQS